MHLTPIDRIGSKPKTQSQAIDEKFISRLATNCLAAFISVIYWNRLRMAYIRNFLNSPNDWTRLNENINGIKPLNSCFYFFSLKTGCNLIAGFEALVNVLQMCSIYLSEMEVKTTITTTESPDSMLVTREPDGDMLGPNMRTPMFETNLFFQKALISLTIFRSVLLIVGAEWVSSFHTSSNNT